MKAACLVADRVSGCPAINEQAFVSTFENQEYSGLTGEVDGPSPEWRILWPKSIFIDSRNRGM